MKPISRGDAEFLGLKHFFTGVPCGNGHIAKRLTSCGNCQECMRIRHESKRKEFNNKSREYQARNPAMNRERVRRWREKNLEYVRKYMMEYHLRKKAEQNVGRL
jgi:hypothetical protein